MKITEKQHNMNKYLLLLIFVGFGSFAQDKEELKQKEKALNESTNLTWEGNKSLSENDFVSAEVDYRKAISKSNDNNAAPYNLGNAYYNKETYSEAFGRFKQAGELANEKPDKHKAYHNMGNVFMKQKQYEKAVEAYKEALRNNPKDEETRYNLALAKELLKKEQDEQDKNDDNKDNKDQKDKKNQDQKNEGDNKEDKDESDKKDEGDEGDKGDEKKEDNKEGEGDKKEEEKKQPEKGDKPQEQKQQPRPNQLSKQQIQNLLEAMQNEEKKVQEKIDAKKVKGAKVKNEKDW
ncbi:MAG: tetratricopeptide repeat protein [Maribacter sp.]|nr:tetratricopeptide repeat protein [Maribacter sp.]